MMLEIHGLTKSYGRLKALNGLDLEIEEGELFGYLGPNGGQDPFRAAAGGRRLYQDRRGRARLHGQRLAGKNRVCAGLFRRLR